VSSTIASSPARSLDDKYAHHASREYLTGIQALVRLPIEQALRDRAAGLRTGTFISGYRGSPVGTYDIALRAAAEHLRPLDIHFVPAVNEELAAAAVSGVQLLDVLGHSRFDGVTGLWYGKSPGVDRSLDVFRHANFGGGPAGTAMVAIAGDDPGAKSSTLPNGSEWDFVACGMPVLYPGSVQDVLTLGLHAIAMSRLTGCFTALKCVTNVCDGGATVALGDALGDVVIPGLDGFVKPSELVLAAPQTLALEQSLFEQRLPAALAYARANAINAITCASERDTLGVVAAGKTYVDVMQALHDLGLQPADLKAIGVRLLRIGMPYPLDPEIVREFAAGLGEIVVVEEKRDLVEQQVRNALYDVRDRPRVHGKHDPGGVVQFPFHGEVDVEQIAARLGPLLRALEDRPSIAVRLRELELISQRRYSTIPIRSPNYCSGCPHSRSTLAVGDEVIAGGIGCHGMSTGMTQPERRAVSLGAMGVEGSAFVGAAPFSDVPHMVQNMGDGTFFHSGSQSIRFCVAAGVDITFKLLYNSAVAMTGGQDAEGGRDVPAITRLLDNEGVRRTVVVSENFDRWKNVALAPNAALYPRERYAHAVRELAATKGVTVLLFDQECALEKRRGRRRGRLPAPQKFVVINEDVCEGCGDCGDVSNCMSVVPTDTELGRKTQIQQSSCNSDYSCLKGDCPSFLTVYTTKGPRPRPAFAQPLAADAVPEPGRRAEVAEPFHLYLPGVGGTGVVTANQVLAYAAMFDGLEVQTLDQTGAAQKGGAVLSSLILRRDAGAIMSNKVGVGQADLVIAFDALGGTAPVNLDRCHPDRTVVVADSTVQPTAAMVRHVDVLAPGGAQVVEALNTCTRAADNVHVPAGELVERLFNDNVLVNTFMIGVAYQSGLLPISAASIEAAFTLNAVAVERNLQAFRYGRLWVHDRMALEPAAAAPTDAAAEATARRAHLGSDTALYDTLLGRAQHVPEELRRVLAIRVGELIAYQDADYAKRYLTKVLAVADAEGEAVGAPGPVADAAARHLFKLMAYKDEYEVARLLLDPKWRKAVDAQFVDAKIKFNLHPPLLRDRGLDRKLELGDWFRVVLRVLLWGRRLRGTRWDPFGRAEVRRVERELIIWYEDVLDQLIATLTPETHKTAALVARAPDRIRGYESIKLRNVEREKALVARKLEEITVRSSRGRTAAGSR
jgi:indolepyruvate ferredoxin oxidoreductase